MNALAQRARVANSRGNAAVLSWGRRQRLAGGPGVYQGLTFARLAYRVDDAIGELRRKPRTFAMNLGLGRALAALRSAVVQGDGVFYDRSAHQTNDGILSKITSWRGSLTLILSYLDYRLLP